MARSLGRNIAGGQGFSLVGLVVTLSIVVTLSGVAAIFYENVVGEQRRTIAANELDEYSKAVRAYILKTRRSLQADQLNSIDPAEDVPGGYHMDFLVEEGLYREINRDPWDHLYRVDPELAVVYSLGPDPSDPTDDIKVPYARRVAGAGRNPFGDVLPNDDIPPVISGIQPVGVIKLSNPTVRASFYDHFGGTIDQGTAKMFIDQVDLTGDPGLTTDSAGQILFSTGGVFAEGNHTVVVQVEDTAGNLARREWTFTVDTVPAIAKIHVPVQGSAIKGPLTPEIEASDDTLRKITVRLDFANVTNKFLGTAAADPQWLGQPPPQTGGGQNYWGTWSGLNTIDPAPNGIPDGTHYFTLLVEDFSGRVISDQSQFLVDNTKPGIQWVLAVDPLAQPPTGPTSPQVIATAVPHFEVRGWDNLQVANIWYEYRNISTGLIAGMRGSNAVTGPELMVPVDWNGDPVGDWGALFNSVEEIASTTANSGAGYTPVTLPEGEYEIHVWTEDLAQNDSKNPLAITTRFVVNLSADGLVGLVFLDMPSPQEPVGPIDLATRTISGLFGPPYPDAYSLTESTIQTRGHLRFTLLRFEFASTPMVAAIDDLTTDILGGWYGGKDGNYHLEPDGFFQDWEAVGTLPTVTGPTHITTDYVPYGNNPPGVNFALRRNEGGQIPGGEYEARVEIPYVLSEKKTAFTTFYIDTEYPLIQGSSVLQVEGPPGTYNDLSAQAWTVDQLTLTSPPAILFGGQLEDRLCDPGLPPARICDQSNARVVQVWARQDHAGPITDASGWELVFPLTGQQSSLIATYGAPATQAGVGPFRLTTSGPATDLEGSHTIDLKAVDGAGHTTAWRSTVLVNALGPLVEFVRIENPQGGTPINLNLVTGPGATTIIEEPFVTIEIQATDEVDLDRIEYRIIEQGGPGTLGANIFPVPPGNQTYNTGDLSIFEDQLGSVFKPSPTSYTLEVFGVAGGKPGPLFTTTLVFQYLVDLAIFAPDYQDDVSVNNGMSQAEQVAVADYLVNNVDNVRSITVYDVNTRVSCTDCTVPADIGTWMSTRAGNTTTDILIVLDAMHEDMAGCAGYPCNDWAIETFVENADGDILIFAGSAQPGLNLRRSDGSIRQSGWTDGNATRDFWRAVLDQSGDHTETAHSDQIRDPGHVQVPTLKAKMLLPSLGVHRPQDLAQTPLTDWFLIQSPRGAITAGSWSVEERFLEDTYAGADIDYLQNDLNANTGDHDRGSPPEGSSFVLQHSSGGRFAFFYAHGHELVGEAGTLERPPVAATGPVIEEFIEQYLTGVNQPDAVGAKVVFAAKPAGTRFVPGAYNATNEHDALIWPVFDGGQEKFRVLTDHESTGFFNTASKREVATIFDAMPDGSAYLVASKGQEDGEVSTVLDAMGVYLIRTDGTRIPLYKNNAAASKFADPIWGRLAENGSRAVVLGAAFQDPNPPPGYNFPVFGSNSSQDPNATVAWLYDLSQNPPGVTQITTNFSGVPGTDEGTIRADLSGDGKVVALVTDVLLSGAAPGNPISNAKRELLTYDVLGDFYDRVTDPGSSVQPSSHGCGANFYDNVEPVDAVISEDGLVIAWIGRAAASAPAGCLGDQEQLLISKNIGGTWRTGKITDCPAATDCEIGEAVTRLDMAHTGGAYPRVIFTTKGNFRGGTIGGTSGSPEDAAGAQPGGSGGPPPPPPGSDITDDFEFTPNNIAVDDFGPGNYNSGTGWTSTWTETGDTGGGPPSSPNGVWSPKAVDDLDGGIGACPAGTACEDFEDPAFPTSGTGTWTAGSWTVVTPGQQSIVPASGCGNGLVHRYDGPKAAGWINLVRTFSHSYYRPQGVVTAQMVCGSGVSCADKRLLFFEHDGVGWKLGGEITDADGCGTFVIPMRPNTSQISIRDAGNGQGLDGNAVDWQAGDHAIVDGIYIRERPTKGCGVDMLCDDFASGYTSSGSGWGANAWAADTSRTSINGTNSGNCRVGNHLRFDKDFDNGREINRAAPAGFFTGAKDLRASFWLQGQNAQGANEYVDFRAESTGSGWTPDLVHQFISDPCTYQDVPLDFNDLKTIEFRNDTDNFDDDSNDYFYLDNLEVYDAAPPVGYSGGSGWAGDWTETSEPGGPGGWTLHASEDFSLCANGSSGGNWTNGWSRSDTSKVEFGNYQNTVCGSGCGLFNDTSTTWDDGENGNRDFRLDNLPGGTAQARIRMNVWFDDDNDGGNEEWQVRIDNVTRFTIDDGSIGENVCVNDVTFDISDKIGNNPVELRFRGGSDNSNGEALRVDDIRIEYYEPPTSGTTGDIQQVRGGAATACRGDGHLALTDTSGGATIERMFAAAVGAGGARLSFNRSFASFLDADDRFFLDYNDGAVWQTLVTWSGGLGAAACQQEVWDLPAGATGLRLRGQNNEAADVLYIDDIVVSEYTPASGCGASRVCEDWFSGDYGGSSGGWSGSWTWTGGDSGTFMTGGASPPYAQDDYLDIGTGFNLNDTLSRQVTNGFFGAATGLDIRIGIDNPAGTTAGVRVEADEWGGGTTVLGTIAAGTTGTQSFTVPFGNIQTLRLVSTANMPGPDTIRIDNIDIYPSTPDGSGAGDIQAKTPSPCGSGGFLEIVDVTAAAPPACPANAICDDFESGSMSGGSPTAGPAPHWTSNWIENGESDGIGSGRLTIVNNDGTGVCRDSWHLHMNDIDGSGKFWERRFDLAGMASPEVSFDVSGENLESGDQIRIWEYDGGWNGPLQTWTGPVTCQRVTVAISGSATRIAFDSNFNWSTTDDSHIDNIVIEAAGAPPPVGAPGPDIERTFPALTMAGSVSFDREFTGFDGAPKGISLEYTNNGGASWLALNTWADTTGDQSCRRESFSLPAGADGIRFIGTGQNTAGDRITVDNVSIDEVDPYGTGSAGWVGSWVEGNDDGDPFSGWIRNMGGFSCIGDNHLVIQDDGVSPDGGQYVERMVDLTGFTFPELVVDYTIGGSSFTDGNGDEEVAVMFHDGSSWSDLEEIHTFPAGCSSRTYALPANPANARIRFEVRGGSWETNDEFHIEEVRIREGVPPPPPPPVPTCGVNKICEDFESYTAGSNSDLHEQAANGGAGWSSGWTFFQQGCLDNRSLILDDGSMSCGTSKFFRGSNWDSYTTGGGAPCDTAPLGARMVRDLDTGIFNAMNEPVITFDLDLAASSSYAIEFQVTDSSGTWVQMGFYDGNTSCGLKGPIDLRTSATGLAGPVERIRFKSDNASSGDNWGGSDYWYVDDIEIYDNNPPPPPPPPGICGTSKICEDFSSGNWTGGQGWNGGWTEDTDNRFTIANVSNPPCQEDEYLHVQDIDGRELRRKVDTALFDSFSLPTVRFNWEWGNNDGNTDENLGFWVTDTPGSGWVNLAILNPNDSCRIEQIDLRPSNTGLGGPVREIRFIRQNGNNWDGGGAKDQVWIDNIQIYDASGGGGGGAGDLHAQRGVYMWLGNFGGSGDHFVHLVNPVGGDAHNPRISPDGTTFVFEVDAQELHGLFGWDPTDPDSSTRRLRQVVDVTAGGTLGGSWGGNARKVVRGRFQGSPNPQMGYSSILQIVAPLDDQGSGTVPLLPFAPTYTATNPFTGWNLPVCTN